MRLIDADALKDKCYITVNGTTISKNNYVMFYEIDEAPTIDAVEVVRCKDCKHRYYADNRVPHERTWVCEHFINEEITDNDFCSFGERSKK